jgi:hypothetical protein
MPHEVAPKGLLLDYGGTLVEEVRSDARAGNEALLARALSNPAQVTIEEVMARANRVSVEVAARVATSSIWKHPGQRSPASSKIISESGLRNRWRN